MDLEDRFPYRQITLNNDSGEEYTFDVCSACGALVIANAVRRGRTREVVQPMQLHNAWHSALELKGGPPIDPELV